jgi:hypothetical protein
MQNVSLQSGDGAQDQYGESPSHRKWAVWEEDTHISFMPLLRGLPVETEKQGVVVG